MCDARRNAAKASPNQRELHLRAKIDVWLQTCIKRTVRELVTQNSLRNEESFTSSKCNCVLYVKMETPDNCDGSSGQEETMQLF